MHSERLVRPSAHWHDVPTDAALVLALAGYRDAGHVVPQLTAHLLDDANETLVASIAIDDIFDYRARRPIVSIDGTTLGGVQMPALELHLLHDNAGTPYVLLAGLEPDFRWSALSDELVEVIDELGISSTTWVHSFAMPVPHTRPVRLSASGNRPEIAEQLSVWSPHTEAPAHFAHVLGARLAEREHPVLGLVALIPHYVADTTVPSGAIAVLEGLGAATGLMLSTSELREADREFRQSVDTQVAGNADVQGLISSLEAQHDAYLAELPHQSSMVQADGLVPTADDIASELEQFLARSRDGDERGKKDDGTDR